MLRRRPKRAGAILRPVVSVGGDVDIAATARLLGDNTRAVFCTTLMDGRFRTAGELAIAAGVAASTASEHLSRLVDGGLLEVFPRGRNRYYRLAGEEVAAVLEALAFVSPPGQILSLRHDRADRALRAARTCYDHLAGRLGVELSEALIAQEIITDDYTVRDPSPLTKVGVEMPSNTSRAPIRPCLDWTERRYHAAGALPAALTQRMFEMTWLQRTGKGRAVRLTARGREGLAELLHTPSFESWES